MTTVNGVDDVPVCLEDACSDSWVEEFFDNLGRKIKVKSKMKKQYCHWKIFNFSLNLEAVYKMLYKWGILWTIYLLYR